MTTAVMNHPACTDSLYPETLGPSSTLALLLISIPSQIDHPSLLICFSQAPSKQQFLLSSAWADGSCLCAFLPADYNPLSRWHCIARTAMARFARCSCIVSSRLADRKTAGRSLLSSFRRGYLLRLLQQAQMLGVVQIQQASLLQRSDRLDAQCCLHACTCGAV